MDPEYESQYKIRNNKIVELRKLGLGYKPLSKQFSLSKTSIKRICHRYGIYGNEIQSKTSNGSAKVIQLHI